MEIDDLQDEEQVELMPLRICGIVIAFETILPELNTQWVSGGGVHWKLLFDPTNSERLQAFIGMVHSDMLSESHLGTPYVHGLPRERRSLSKTI